jgi:hypothetical protein
MRDAVEKRAGHEGWGGRSRRSACSRDSRPLLFAVLRRLQDAQTVIGITINKGAVGC